MTPTDKQLEVVRILKKAFLKSCEADVDSGGYCAFYVQYNPTNEQDSNITVTLTLIDRITNEGIPITTTSHKLIEPNGRDLFLSDFMTQTEIVTYLEKLKDLKYE